MAEQEKEAKAQAERARPSDKSNSPKQRLNSWMMRLRAALAAKASGSNPLDADSGVLFAAGTGLRKYRQRRTRQEVWDAVVGRCRREVKRASRAMHQEQRARDLQLYEDAKNLSTANVDAVVRMQRAWRAIRESRASAAVEADPENGVRFVTMKSRPVLETEADIDGVATVEAYQVTDQCVGLVKVEAFSQAKTDPRVAKTKADCCFIVEKKEQRKATVEMFVARVFDVGRQLDGKPFASYLGSGFAIENRPTEPQDAGRMASYLRARKGKEAFVRTVADLHCLLFLANFLDLATDLPVLCSKILEGSGDDLDGFQMMINSYAGLDA